MSRDKIVHDSRSISAALARGVSPTAIVNEEKALGTRLSYHYDQSQQEQTKQGTNQSEPINQNLKQRHCN